MVPVQGQRVFLEYFISGLTIQSATAVESKPTEPNKNSTNEDKCRVVRLAMDLLAFRQTFAEDEGVSQSGPPGGDVDGTATSEVKGGQVI